MRVLLFLLLAAGLILVNAQESPATVAKNEAEENKPVDDNDSESQIEIETPDTFEATEKLSEDVSAPFPVDI